MPVTKKGSLGKPGNKPKSMAMAAAKSNASGCAFVSFATVVPRLSSEAARVTMKPAAAETSKAGI